MANQRPKSARAGGDVRTSAQSRPSTLSADARRTLAGCFALLAGKVNHGLPEQLAGFVRGEVDCMPVSLGWVPERMRPLLALMREIFEGQRNRRAAAPSVHFEPAAPGETVADGDELQIEFSTDSHWTARGTRAQLEAAGLVPEGVTWPEGTDGVQWTTGNLLFNLWRDRFTASRKLKKAQPQGDFWMLRCWRNDKRLRFVEIEVRSHMRAIQELMHGDTKAGKEQFDRYLTAQCDDGFQRFMKGIVPRQGKSGSKATQARTQEGGAA